MQLYTPDNSLPGIPVLLDPTKLRESLGDWLGTGELKLVKIRYKPNTSCLVSYCIEQNGNRDFIYAKAFQSDDWQVRSQKFGKSAWVNNELAVAVFRFPDDNKLASLGTLQSDPDQFFSRVLLDDQEFGKVNGIQTLAYKPNRRYVAMVCDENKNHAVLKLHCKSTFKSASAAAATIKKLGIDGLPSRIGRSKRHRALAYQWIDGSPFDFGKVERRDLPQTINQIFDFLDRIHRPVDTQKFKVAVRPPMTGTRPVAKYLNLICSPIGTTANQILRQLIDNRPSQYQPLLSHGDFYDRQLLTTGNRLIACDFDELCVDDATADIANFVANLRLGNAVGKLKSDFVNETDSLCREQLKAAESKVVRRYLWNQAIALMRLSTHPFRSGNSKWVEQIDSVLNQCKSLFDEMRPAISHSCSDFPTQDHRKLAKLQEDSSFEFLREIDGENATEILKKQAPRLAKRFGNFAVAGAKPIRHKEGRRCLVEFELATDKGTRFVLGKSSAKRTDKKAYNAQRRLFRKHGFNSSAVDGICTPRTYGCCEPWQMWLQDKVDAKSAGELMDSGDFASVVDRIAPAIHKLHESRFAPQRTHGIAEEMKILSERLAQVRNSNAVLGPRIATILEKARSIADLINSVSAVPTSIHRDFYQDQILFSQDKTYLIDLDLIATGPAALDVGNFLAHLTEHGIRVHNDPYFWSEQEEQILSHWLRLANRSSSNEVAGCKALSLARHIAISQSIQSRNETTSRIVEHTEYLFGEFLNTATRTRIPVNSIGTGELI